MQEENLTLTNVTKGIYPLYKMLTEISDQDRIIGIDPGIRFHITEPYFDLVSNIDVRSVDCAPQESSNQTREHSLSISNRFYKKRSSMQ